MNFKKYIETLTPEGRSIGRMGGFLSKRPPSKRPIQAPNYLYNYIDEYWGEKMREDMLLNPDSIHSPRDIKLNPNQEIVFKRPPGKNERCVYYNDEMYCGSKVETIHNDILIYMILKGVVALSKEQFYNWDEDEEFKMILLDVFDKSFICLSESYDDHKTLMFRNFIYKKVIHKIETISKRQLVPYAAYTYASRIWIEKENSKKVKK